MPVVSSIRLAATAATGASSGQAIVWQLLIRALWKELTESYTMAVHISGPDPHIHHVLGRLLWH